MTQTKEFLNLKELLNNKKAIIGIVGMGYVGLPLALAYAKNGFKVIGLDIDEKKVEKINRSESYIKHIPNEEIYSFVSKGLIKATSNFEESKYFDAIILCVPTPLNKYREPDLSFIRETTNSLLPFLKEGQILSLESTSYPGTTKEELLPLISARGFDVGKNFFLIYSPEREDPGNKLFNTSNTPKVLGGITENCKNIGIELYKHIVNQVVPVRNTCTAEMTKLLENIHRAVNIGLMNELKPLADKMDVDLYEVIRAAATKPFGFVPYYPGPGLGGHCIPIDPFYLTWKAREYGMHTRFIELAGEINSSMPQYVVDKITWSLNDNKKPLKDSNILVLGLGYKKNVDDMRESPSVEIMKLLSERQASVSYSDPFFREFPIIRKFKINSKSIDITKETLQTFDAVILITDHDIFDYELIKENSKLIIDTRGRYEPSNSIVRA
tara:strand:+ start:626 stop:1945 length:1320 start_codon:yes stop_codon:yes gene_type:complete